MRVWDVDPVQGDQLLQPLAAAQGCGSMKLAGPVAMLLPSPALMTFRSTSRM